MRHRKRNAKLGRKGDHRNAMLANLVCSLIKNRRVTTTLAKAKAARPVAEKMVTLAKKGTLHHRRLADSRLPEKDAVTVLFRDIAETHRNRNGGYTRIIRLHQRPGDAAQMAILEWVDEVLGGGGTAAQAAAAKPVETAPPQEKAAPVADEAATVTPAGEGGETVGGVPAKES
ncbi:MAG: 50S ribosomal protein L17 [Verrucomicrobiales bacterium]|nr:50S ribosomal protein L17 [Verrucomicrobiales bacterium]